MTLTSKTMGMILDIISLQETDGSVQVTLHPTKDRRSHAQNSLVHLWFREIAEGYELSHGVRHAPDVWKQYLKRLFLGQEPVEMLGHKMVAMRQTSKLTVKEMAQFMEDIDRWAAQEIELQLSHPEDLYYEAIGK